MKMKKNIKLIKNELGGEIMTEFIGLTPKTYSCLTDDNDTNKRVKGKVVCHKMKT